MRQDGDDADMAAALDQFDRVAANLEKLEDVWKQLREADTGRHRARARHTSRENLVRSFAHIAGQLPAIHRWFSRRCCPVTSRRDSLRPASITGRSGSMRGAGNSIVE